MARASTRRNTSPMSPRAVGRVSPVTFIQETMAELRKSVWPSREETARLTVVVIVLAGTLAAFLAGLDTILDFVFASFVL